MEDQIKELIAKGIKLDYREIVNDYEVILRWGDDVHYIECMIAKRQPRLITFANLVPDDGKGFYSYIGVPPILVPQEEIDEIKNSIEMIIMESMKDLKSIYQKQVDDNFKAFNEILPTILDARRNQYALMKNCKIVEYFSTFKDANKAGCLLYSDHMFSVQKVTDEVINLGAFSL